jgi:hypothetical protein
LKSIAKKLFLSLSAAFLIGILPVCLLAQNFQIEQVLPYLSEDSLKVDITIDGLLEDQVQKTLLAGLPLSFSIELVLFKENEKEVAKRQYFSKINYDVWEERFRVWDFTGSVREFELLDNVKKWCKNIRNLGLVSKNRLDTGETYRVMSSVELVPLDKKQNKQLQWWLENSDPTEEELASEERSTGFKLNLNQLVQMLFSGSKKPERYTRDQVSDSFKLSDLQFQ